MLIRFSLTTFFIVVLMLVLNISVVDVLRGNWCRRLQTKIVTARLFTFKCHYPCRQACSAVSLTIIKSSQELKDITLDSGEVAVKCWDEIKESTVILKRFGGKKMSSVQTLLTNADCLTSWKNLETNTTRQCRKERTMDLEMWPFPVKEKKKED